MTELVTNSRTILRPEWLIDGLGDQPRTGCEVVIEGGRICAVRDTEAVDSGNARVVELPGASLLPGLIDCHVHYTIDASREDGIAQGANEPRERAVLIGARNARVALLSGVTTARSAGASRSLDVALAAAIDRGDVPGPRLIAAGGAITITGGHGQAFGVEVDSLDEMIRAVRTLARDGSKVIKLVASEAAMLTSDIAGVQELSVADMTAMTREAARLHRGVLAHAQSSDAVISAAAAGVDSVEHAFLADEDALRHVKDSGAFLTPTLTVTDVYSTRPDLTPERRERQAEIAIRHRVSCQTAIRLGIPLVAGTDCGVPGLFSDMLSREIALLHDHGLSAMDAIRAATVNAARLLRMSEELGSIEVGKKADLMAVAADPTRDLAALRYPVLVVKNGEIVLLRQTGQVT